VIISFLTSFIPKIYRDKQDYKLTNIVPNNPVKSAKLMIFCFKLSKNIKLYYFCMCLLKARFGPIFEVWDATKPGFCLFM